MSAAPVFVVFSGSARRGSLNCKLAEAACTVLRGMGADVNRLHMGEYPMPLYDGDLEAKNGLPENALKVKEAFISADGFVIASPEYNSAYSPLLKNTIDWASRQHTPNEPSLFAFAGKTAALLAASPGGLGGLRGLVPLRLLLSNIGVHVVPSQLAVGQAPAKFSHEDATITDAAVQKQLLGVCQELFETTYALKAFRESTKAA